MNGFLKGLFRTEEGKKKIRKGIWSVPFFYGLFLLAAQQHASEAKGFHLSFSVRETEILLFLPVMLREEEAVNVPVSPLKRLRVFRFFFRKGRKRKEPPVLRKTGSG